MKKLLKAFQLSLILATATVALVDYSFAQNIRVDPNGVNVNSQGSTVVFLTFGSLRSTQVPAEGCWCGELVRPHRATASLVIPQPFSAVFQLA